MFKKLTDFSYKRSVLEAMGFFVAYLFLGGVIAGIIGSIYGIAIHATDEYQAGLKAGSIFSVFYCAFLAFMIVKSKKLFNLFGGILLFLLSIFGAMILGAFGGLIPVSILSAMKTKDEILNVEETEKTEE